MDARVPLLKAGLFVVACAAGGFGAGVLIAAVIGKRLWDGLQL